MCGGFILPETMRRRPSVALCQESTHDPFFALSVLRESGDLSDTPGGWTRYVDYLSVLSEEDAARRNAKFGRLSKGWVIGSPEFKQSLKKELQELATAGDRFALLGA